MPPDPNEGPTNFGQTDFGYIDSSGAWHPLVDLYGGMGGLTPGTTNLLKLLNKSDDPGEKEKKDGGFLPLRGLMVDSSGNFDYGHPDIDHWLKTHPPKDPDGNNPPDRPIVKAYPGPIGPDLTNPFFKYRDQTPHFTKKKDGKPCDDQLQDRIKDAWAGVMDKLKRGTTSLNGSLEQLQKNLKGCNAAMDKIIDCLSKMPDYDFKSGLPGPSGGQLVPLQFQCDSDMKDAHGNASRARTSKDGKIITFNPDAFGSFKDQATVLQSTILHELVHRCTPDSSNPDNVNGELDAKFFETLFYGSSFPMGINSKRFNGSDDNSNLANFCAICRESDIVKKMTGSNEGSGIIRSKNIGWDLDGGNSWIYCDDGSTLALNAPNGETGRGKYDHDILGRQSQMNAQVGGMKTLSCDMCPP